jgi:hypothetical protein
MSDLRLTREGLCRTFQLTPETLAEFERAGILRPGEDNLFDLAQTAGALFGFGMSRAASAERKVGAVALAIQDVMPALQRLANLPDRAGLEGEARQRVTDELSAFFNAFAGLMTRAKDALEQED